MSKKNTDFLSAQINPAHTNNVASSEARDSSIHKHLSLSKGTPFTAGKMLFLLFITKNIRINHTVFHSDVSISSESTTYTFLPGNAIFSMIPNTSMNSHLCANKLQQ